MDIRFLYLAIGGFFGVIVGAAFRPAWEMASDALENQPDRRVLQLSEQDIAAQEYSVALSIHLMAKKNAEEAYARWYDSIYGEEI